MTTRTRILYLRARNTIVKTGDERTASDAVWAFAIGVLLGVGASLLLGAGPDDDVAPVLRRLRDQGFDARIASRRMRRELDEVVAVARRYAEGSER
jgi:hypothetical protein